MKIDRLFVLWADADGRRHVVGHLERTREVVRFWYDLNAADARKRGFIALPGLEDITSRVDPARAYEARYLFSTFAERIPSRSRADAAAVLASWGVEKPDDQFEVLARSSGVRATDRIELAEYRADDDQLLVPLEFRLAGGKHCDPVSLRAGTSVEFRREPGNEYDANATIVVALTDRKAGYVPAQYAPLFARLLDSGARLEASAVRQLVLPDAGRWVIRASHIRPE